ncbi:hypothetical protein ATO6_22695 [Oceanicola sp. 22II-s10i]|uniref:hypothetical protein n=1 Tax=Oceanicola sp. 22II-s10i TaxID=1317116 RepID=UPI000B5242EA|nr:hypothetical protein [Oceanicola sp. 22II-s10i]OWU82254.1 hypothetical protein ATO6_22695 [Oceanicola sp. 22II-s10i]
MKIAIFIPNEQWSGSAGVRIRYDRIRPLLAAAGHEMELFAIDAVRDGKGLDADICLLSKCNDARAIALAARLQASGKRVGVDIFDDYFSQTEDPRFVHLRVWFRSLLPHLDFILCATEAMRGLMHDLAPGLPCHVLNDPHGGYDPALLAERLEANAARARATRTLEIGWFGTGDNPHFSVGLQDLAAMSGALAGLRGGGYRPRLSILTNKRAMTVDRLELLSRLPVPYRLEEWTEERETALISRSLVCFLPVNAQNFSVVKSLNRGITTLTKGAQVLSAGYRLYDPLEEFVYRDAAEIVGDLDRNRLRLRKDTLSSFSRLMRDLGDPAGEAVRLADFLSALPVRAVPGAAPVLAVIHGVASTGDIHKTVQKLDCLSVPCPVNRVRLNFDVDPAFDPRGGHVDVALSERAMAALAPRWRDRVRPGQDKVAGRLRLDAADLPQLRPVRPQLRRFRHLLALERYHEDLALVGALLDLLFDDVRVFLSERNSPYLTRLPHPAGRVPERMAAE